MDITVDIYDSIVEYSRKKTSDKVGRTFAINHLDIAHEVIADPDFSENWKLIVVKHIYAKVKELKIKHIELDQSGIDHYEVKYPCQGCHEDFPKEKFQMSFKLCNKCYRESNKDRINANTRRWRKNHPEKVKENNRIYKSKRKQKDRDYMSEYRRKNSDSISEYNRKYRQDKKEKLKEQRLIYYLKNKK